MFSNDCKGAAGRVNIPLKVYREEEDKTVSIFFISFQTLKEARAALHVANQLTQDIKTDFCKETMPDGKDDYEALYTRYKVFMASASYQFTDTGISFQDGPISLFTFMQKVNEQFGKYAESYKHETRTRHYKCSREVAETIKAAFEQVGVCLVEGAGTAAEPIVGKRFVSDVPA